MKPVRVWLLVSAMFLATVGHAGAIDILGCCVCDCSGATTCTDGPTVICPGVCADAGCSEQSAPPVACAQVPGCPQAQPATGAPALGPFGLTLALAAAIGSAGVAFRRRQRA